MQSVNTVVIITFA